MEEQTIHSKKVTFATVLVALGIIYGDIGTSPLYVLRAVVGDRPITEILVYGGVSLIFWTLVFQTTIKYVWITLKADNHGEGGIFSLYALVRNYGKYLVIPTILGATTLLADGIITPPISVASAIEGLDMIVPGIPTVPIVLFILSALFFFQRFGTHKVGSVFGPAMVVWFSMLFILGAKEIAHYPGVLKSLNPYYGYQLLVHYPKGFWLLGAVFLATTGAEALYSDLGHCGRKNIRISWAFVKVCLMANYIGQAAWIMSQQGVGIGTRNAFFEIMPHWFLIPGIIIATVATIIASQALISGSFTLISEAMSLNFWPRIAVKQPTELKGQIYIPSINMILWIGCVMMVLYFQNSANMEAAYGFSITIAMMMTTILLSYYLIYIRKWNIALVILFLLVFGVIESSFFITNVAKIKQRWMFLFFEFFIFTVMYTWFYARKIHNRMVRFVKLNTYTPILCELSQDENMPKFATHLIYLTKANHENEIEEKIINSILSKKPKRADVYWFVHIHRTNDPYTLNYEVTELVDDRIIKVTINTGFRVQPRTELYFKKIVQDLVANKELNLHLRPDGSSKYNSEPDFRFVVIERFLSVENEFTLRNGTLLKMYFFLKKLGQKDEKAFGLDKSDVIIEQSPLVYQSVQKINLVRKEMPH
ncbi:MAG TPA: KUP/HAK/KT family potassium transporter [Bacteroidia bacterium]|jgi:KUP system potassium uptake protein|nr:KUP/HAK/KT family potassium transporter [Bacteroidia bacterium]